MKVERKLVKKTVIPITIIDDPKELNGLIHFPTETHHKAVVPHQSTINFKKHSVMYRNQVIRENEGGEEEENRRRELELYEIVIAPNRTKEKQFRVEVPVTKSNKSNRMYKSSEVYFKFNFNHSFGQLMILNGIQDAKMEIITKGSATTKEKLEEQLRIMDKRVKDPTIEGKYYEEEEDQ